MCAEQVPPIPKHPISTSTPSVMSGISPQTCGKIGIVMNTDTNSFDSHHHLNQSMVTDQMNGDTRGSVVVVVDKTGNQGTRSSVLVAPLQDTHVMTGARGNAHKSADKVGNQVTRSSVLVPQHGNQHMTSGSRVNNNITMPGHAHHGPTYTPVGDQAHHTTVGSPHGSEPPHRPRDATPPPHNMDGRDSDSDREDHTDMCTRPLPHGVCRHPPINMVPYHPSRLGG